RRHFSGFERVRRIRTAVGAPQSKMFFNKTGPERHRGNGNIGAECVIGEPDRTAEFRAQLRNPAKVALLDRCRVSAYAVEQYQIAAAGGVKLFDGLGDLL